MKKTNIDRLRNDLKNLALAMESFYTQDDFKNYFDENFKIKFLSFGNDVWEEYNKLKEGDK
jgi:hypothetical protein|tara:strand:+ start:567 stop:749 length:183 start_codon:yes stop_codon:yes gene_type:complete